MTLQRLVADLKSRALISVNGPDWRGFLQGLLTQNVETLGPGDLRYAAILTPQGKLLADMFVLGDANGCRLDVAADAREGLIARLSMYRLRATVDIAPAEGSVLALWPADTADQREGWRPDPRLPALGLRGYGAVPPIDASAATEAAYLDHRLDLGVPDPAQDAPAQTTYPSEANLDLLGAIDFHKGCFVGQETTSRMKRRGAIKNRMLALTFEGDPPAFGAEVMAGDLRAGEVRGVGAGRAMALLRLDRIDGPLTVNGRLVAVKTPDYFLPIPSPSSAAIRRPR